MENLFDENKITLLKVPNELYALLDTEFIGENAPSAQIGNITVVDDTHIKLDISSQAYFQAANREEYLQKNKTFNMESVPTQFTCRVIDAQHRDMFMFTNSDKEQGKQNQ